MFLTKQGEIFKLNNLNIKEKLSKEKISFLIIINFINVNILLVTSGNRNSIFLSEKF